MKNNTQHTVSALGWARRKKSVVIAICSAVILLGALTAAVVYAMPNTALNQIEANFGYGGRSPNPGSMLLYRGNNIWSSSFANRDPGISTGSGIKHILKNQDSGQIRQIFLKSYYTSDADARNAVYQIQRGVCDFEASNAGSSVPRRLQISLNATMKYDRNATNGNMGTVCNGDPALGGFQNFEFNIDTGNPPGFDYGSGLYYNDLVFTLTGDDVGVTGQRNQVRFQVRHTRGTSTMGMAATSDARNFGLVEGGAEDPDTSDAQRYGIAAGIGFGKSCLDADTTPGTISVYDPDAGKFGTQHVFVLRRDPEVSMTWQRLGPGDTTAIGGAIAWNTATNRFDITGVDRTTASIRLDNFKNTYDYLLAYDNPPDSGGSLTPQGNVISLGIPGDTIHGELFTNCKFNLTPYVGGITSPTFVGNYSHNITGSVSNSESNTIWGPHQPPWRITKAIFPNNPNRAGNGQGITIIDNCSWMYSRGAGGCQEIGALAMPATSSYTPPTDSGTVPVGSYVCYMTSILATQYVTASPADWRSQWRHSDMTCAVSVKKPSMGVNYGDVRTGGSFDSCRINLAGGVDRAIFHGITMADYGSGVQHSYVNGAALSVGKITNFASLSAGPPGAGTASMRGHFARGPGAGNGGLFYGDINEPTAPASVGTHCLSPVFARQNPTSTSRVLPIPAIPGVNDQTTTYTHDLGGGGTLTLGAIDIPARQRVVVRVTGSGTIVLNGNIRYFGGVAVNTINQLAQFTLLADGPINIVVADGVTLLDGIYAGRGDFYTCQSHSINRAVTAAQCTTQLRINGSVIVAGRLYPHRTAGHTIPTDTTSAELFTLRPDILLSDYADSGATPGLSITSQRELAPRY